MKSDYQISVIGRIRKMREKRGYSQAQLATALGISNGQLGNIESSKPPHKYTLSQIYKISKLFDVHIENFFVDDACVVTIDSLIKSIIRYEE